MLVPHLGDWRDAGIVARAREANMPPLLITSHAHAGDLPSSMSAAALSTPEIELTSLKPAEDGRGFIARLADRHGRGGLGDLLWLDARFPISVGPFEVATLRLFERHGRWTSEPCDMLERATG